MNKYTASLFPRLPLTIGVLLCAVAFARAGQSTKFGFYEGAEFGSSLLVLGDLDEDGVEEFAVGAPTAACDLKSPGRVLVLSGATRSVLQVWQGEPTHGGFGTSLRTVADVNRDGAPDVLVGYWGSMRCEVRSGRDGKHLLAFDRDADEVLSFGDANHDGVSDFLLVDATSIEIRDGRDGVARIGSARRDSSKRAHPVGDLDGDGFVDLVSNGEELMLLLSAPEDLGEGRITGYFPRAGQRPLADRWPAVMSWNEHKDAPPWEFVAAFPAGDLDQDGSADLLLSLKRGDTGVAFALSLHKPEPLFVISGKSGMGYAASTIYAANGQGHPTLLLSGPVEPFSLRVRAHSGEDGKEQWSASWGDRGGTSEMCMTRWSNQPDAGGVLIGSSCYGNHGPICRVGELRELDAATGEVRWVLSVDEVPELSREALCGSAVQGERDR